mmetsp:Transcript_32257/g.110999  ORF Transcript_32257/g.110999 Transcript_32257/m.110999 type:complete len:241 (+) Transcript_32257:981-1703(+)
MATRSMPMAPSNEAPVNSVPSAAIFSLVPTPSAPETKTTSSPAKPAAAKSNMAPKPPMPPDPGTLVAAARGLMRSTSALPLSMSTPAIWYVSSVDSAVATWAGLRQCAGGAKRRPASPAPKRDTASTSAAPSRSWTRCLSASASSPARTAHAFCTTTTPLSTSSVTSCTVQPDSVLPAARTAAWTSRSMPPPNSGRRLGWTLKQRPFQCATNAGERMRIQPTSSTSSTPSSSRAAVSLAS